MLEPCIATGSVDGRYEPVRRLFESYLSESPGLSAQLCVYRGGVPVVDLAGGPHLGPDSLTGVFSASKGVAAFTVARLLDERRLDPDQTVAHYWPEFAAAGKATVTVRQLLSHQAGLAALAGSFALDEILLDSAAGADRLARQSPLWRPGSAFGYHALTIGLLVEELVRRITGHGLQELYDTDIRAPRNADFYLGLPEPEDDRYVPLMDPVLTPAQRAEVAAAPAADPLATAVFGNVDVPPGNGPDGVTTNNPRVRRAGPAAIGGVGSARGLARLYADTLASAASPIASPATFAAMARQQSWGTDRVLNVTNCFGLVFMLPQPRLPFGSLGAFGHDGAGGALAFADPVEDLAFGYVPAPMQHPGGADARAVALARLAKECAHR